MSEPTPHPSWSIRWRPEEQPPAPQRAAIHRLAAAIRRMNAVLMDADLAEAELLAAAEAAERFAERLEAAPRSRPHWGFSEAANAGDPRGFFDSSPLIGLANPVAPPLRLEPHGSEVVGTAVFGQQYEGPPGHVHGGFVAAAFDEVLGMVQSATGNPGMTGTLTVRYRRPTPLLREVRFHGRVERVEGRKIFTTATLHDGDTLCAEAEGIFISVPQGRFRELAERSGQL